MVDEAYVLITPARNEEDYIEKTIQSVTGQTILPKKWIVVSDNSVDRTDEIVTKYAREFDFIRLVRVPRQNQRDFESKANAIKAGLEHLRGIEYSFIGNLDADVAFDPGYFEAILGRFRDNPKLGIAGGIIAENIKGNFISQNISLNSVAGAVQLFRVKCYQEIGGYIPIKYGGIDAVAEVMARMKGWEVQTFPEIKVMHLRRVGTGGRNILIAKFNQGRRDFLLGYHPLFYALSSIYRVIDRPYFMGSLLRMFGYCCSSIRGEKRLVASDFIKYFRKEQMQRIKLLLSPFNRQRVIKTSRLMRE